MIRRSAALLLHREGPNGMEVFLVHPGGPFWARRDDGAWSLPKGEYGPDEAAESAARREFEEETGFTVPPGEAVALGEVVQSGGKVVSAFALGGDVDADAIRSNSCEIEWPPRSGRRLTIPEIDRAAWFSIADAEPKLIVAQRAFLGRLTAVLGLLP